MKRASEVAAGAGIAPRAGKEPTEDELAEVEFVLNTAQAVAQGMSLETALASTTFRTRMLAIRFCALDDERRPAMKALLDEAIRSTGAFVCEAGVFGPEELSQGEARKTYKDGKEVGIEFAVGHTSDGRPIYPNPEKRGPRIYSFRNGPPPNEDGSEPKGKWWEQLEDSEQ